jgi:hypothetical protein
MISLRLVEIIVLIGSSGAMTTIIFMGMLPKEPRQVQLSSIVADNNAVILSQCKMSLNCIGNKKNDIT